MQKIYIVATNNYSYNDEINSREEGVSEYGILTFLCKEDAEENKTKLDFKLFKTIALSDYMYEWSDIINDVELLKFKLIEYYGKPIGNRSNEEILDEIISNPLDDFFEDHLAYNLMQDISLEFYTIIESEIYE